MKMFALTLASCCALIPAAFAADTVSGADVVGTILGIEGQATITTAGSSPAIATPNAPVHPRDVLSTGPGGRLFVQMIDNTELTLGENGQMTVDDYAFNDKDYSANHAAYSIIKGTFLFVDGLLGKTPNPDIRVNIPYGTIGIRGTKFWGGNLDGTYGVIVGEGQVQVQTAHGLADLTKGQATTIANADATPTAPQGWAPDKLARAVATVALKNPEIVGQRMRENVQRNMVLRARHDAILEQRLNNAPTSGTTGNNSVANKLHQLETQKTTPVTTTTTTTTTIGKNTLSVQNPAPSLNAATQGATDNAAAAIGTIKNTVETTTQPVTGAVQTTVETTTAPVTSAVKNTVETTAEPAASAVQDTVKETVQQTTTTVKDTGSAVKSTTTKTLSVLKTKK